MFNSLKSNKGNGDAKYIALLAIVIIVAGLLIFALVCGEVKKKSEPDGMDLPARVKVINDEEKNLTPTEATPTDEPASTVTEAPTPEPTATEVPADDTTAYYFRNADRLNEHYIKHGEEMGFASAKEYEEAASAVVNNIEALHKTEAEDGDDVYYIEATNEFVIVSSDGYIRTYFNPSGGIDYYNRQ